MAQYRFTTYDLKDLVISENKISLVGYDNKLPIEIEDCQYR